MMIFFLRIPILIVFVVLVFSACGKRRPPLPPAERIAQRVDIDGRQVGDRIDISWKMPARNAKAGNTLQITRIDIYRLAEKLTDSLSLTEQQFDLQSTLIGSIPIDDSDFGLKIKTYSDKLRIAGQAARLRYAIKFVNSAGQKAAYSNFFLIEPSANIAAAPSGLSAEVTQEAIVIGWKTPGANLDGSQPPNVAGYNIYRKSADQGFQLLNKTPNTDTKFTDSAFQFGTEYQYFVRTVSLGRNASNVESFGSEVISVEPADTFAPEPPGSITVASAPSTISLFFAFNVEKDVVGYKIYRSTNPKKTKSAWDLLTPDLLESNTFQDTDAVSNVVYYYYVIAVDSAGNLSRPSNVVSETAI